MNLELYEGQTERVALARQMQAMVRQTQTCNPITIKKCKYLLPCGKCDKTDEMCSQFKEIKV